MKRLSLKTKSTIVISLMAILLSVIAILISYRVYSNTMDNHYRTNAMNIAKAAASLMDGDKIAEYIDKVEALDNTAADYKDAVQAIKDEDYKRMLHILFELKDSHEALYLYVQKVSSDGAEYIIDADLESSACELGETYPLAEVNYQYLNRLEYGLPAFITNQEEYGWLCTAGAPIFDRNHSVVALAFVDISMDDVMADRHRFLLLICSILILTAAIATTFIIMAINKTVLQPINALSTAASKFITDKYGRNKEYRDESVVTRREAHTGDEIEKLTYAIKTMEKDINSYIENLTAITAEKERIGTELNVAKQIQTSMLPCIFPAFPERKEFDVYAAMLSAKEVGGDFYDFFLVDQDHLAVVIADVSGNGVPAALFMVIAKTLIKNQTLAGKSPAEVFTLVNTQLYANNATGMSATAWLGVLEIPTGKFTFVNAGHNPPFLRKAGQGFEALNAQKDCMLAVRERITYHQNETILKAGDMLFLYTDGLTMSVNLRDEYYGETRLQEVLNRYLDAAPGELLIEVIEDMNDFVKDSHHSDDITILALGIRGNGEGDQQDNP